MPVVAEVGAQGMAEPNEDTGDVVVEDKTSKLAMACREMTMTVLGKRQATLVRPMGSPHCAPCLQ